MADTGNRDDDLRQRFTKLRAEDEFHADAFHNLLHRARPSAGRTRFSVWAAAGLAVILAFLVVLDDREGRRAAPAPEATITAWKSPTAFLLRTPGEEVLTTVPKIGAWPASEAPGAKSTPRKEAKPLRKKVSRLLTEEHLS